MSSEYEPASEISVEEEASFRYMFRLAAPMIVTTISFTVMQFVDRFMVSRLGTAELAAILPAGFIGFLPGSFAVGIFASVSIYVSHSLGKRQVRQCSSYAWQSIYMGLAYFVVVIAILWPMAPWIFRALGHEQDVVSLEVIYFRIVLYAQAVGVLIWSSSNFFMGIHRPVITMYAALCGQIVNVAANYVLIFGKFGFPAMGIAGAGWGTFIGIVVGATIRMAAFLSGGMDEKFGTRRATRIDFGKMYNLLKIGAPAGVELMLNVTVWGAVLFWLVGKFGKSSLAASNAVLACTSMSVMPVVGLKLALGAAVGKAIGAGRTDVAEKQTGLCVKIGLLYMGLVGICFFVFRNGIMHLWSSDDKVIQYGVDILIYAAIYQVFHATRTVYSGALRGAGDTLWLALASALGAVLVLGVGGRLLVEFYPSLGPVGPWIAATASIITVGLANQWRFKSHKWKQIDLFKRHTFEPTVENEAKVE